MENQYKKLELLIHNFAEKNPAVERKLRDARFEMPVVLAKVITENEDLHGKLAAKKREIEKVNKMLDCHIELLANK